MCDTFLMSWRFLRHADAALRRLLEYAMPLHVSSISYMLQDCLFRRRAIFSAVYFDS